MVIRFQYLPQVNEFTWNFRGDVFFITSGIGTIEV